MVANAPDPQPRMLLGVELATTLTAMLADPGRLEAPTIEAAVSGDPGTASDGQ